VRDFDVSHEGLFTTASLARELLDTFGVVVTELEGHAAAEAAGRGTARQGTAGKGVARAAILEDLGILRRTARSMSVVMPGVEDKFRLPHKGDDQELLNTARAALAEARLLKVEFLRREVPESIFQDLEENIAAFEAALTGQYKGKEESTAAGASIDALIDRGLEALRQLDPIVRNKLHNNHAALAVWLKARRTERAPHRSKPDAPDTPDTPTQ
jgi:hypothetical protein